MFLLSRAVTSPPIEFVGKTVPFDVPERELVISVIQSSQKGSAVLCLTL